MPMQTCLLSFNGPATLESTKSSGPGLGLSTSFILWHLGFISTLIFRRTMIYWAEQSCFNALNTILRSGQLKRITVYILKLPGRVIVQHISYVVDIQQLRLITKSTPVKHRYAIIGRVSVWTLQIWT